MKIVGHPVFLSLPSFSNDDFQRAIGVLELCTHPALPDYDFPYPFTAPGGNYGNMWWQLDFSLALPGIHWLNPEFARQSFLNFETAQKPDGRIPLWGNDTLPDYQNGKPLQRNGTSSFPRLFDSAERMTAGITDKVLLNRIQTILKKYLDWWFHDRQDPETKLISAVFEETFIPYYGYSGEYAPVDLNVEIVHGCRIAADLAIRLHQKQLAEKYQKRANEVKNAIRRFLWNPEDRLFAALFLKTKRFNPVRMAGSFAALRYQIASPEQKQDMIRVLTDPSRFGWGNRGLTSTDRMDPEFTVIPDGHVYTGNPCWSGSIWGTINENVVRGLLDCGEKALAADLADHTLQLFKNRYCEFLNPDTGNACGVMDYAWTAALCLDLIFSRLCGISFDRTTQTLKIQPNLPESYLGKEVIIRNLPLAEGSRLSLQISCKTQPEIRAEISSPTGTRSFKGYGLFPPMREERE